MDASSSTLTEAHGWFTGSPPRGFLRCGVKRVGSYCEDTFGVDSVSCTPPGCCLCICFMETISVQIPALEIATIPTTGPHDYQMLPQPHAALALSQCWNGPSKITSPCLQRLPHMQSFTWHLNLQVGQGAQDCKGGKRLDCG